MNDKIMFKLLKSSSPSHLNHFNCTLNKNINTNVFTHLYYCNVKTTSGFLHRADRFFHHLVDDLNYRLENKYIKNNLKILDKNIKWLQSVNSLQSYIGVEDTSDENRELLVKLDGFNSLDKIKDGFDKETLLNYLESKYSLLETVMDFIPNTSIEFRRNHIINNPLVQYLFRLISSNINDLNSSILIKCFNFLLELDVDDSSLLLTDLYLGIWKSLELESANEDERIDTKIKLLSKIINKVDASLINDKVEELLIRSLCSNEVYYNNINELIQITYYFYTKESNTNGFFNDYIDNYLDNFVLKLNNYIFLLNNNSLINSLYFLYKTKYVDTDVFNKFIEAILFRFDSLGHQEMEVLVSILSSYKYLFIMSGVDLGESIYSEGGKMLLGMMKSYFNDKLVNLRLQRMIEPLISLTMLTKSNNTLKSLILKKLDSNMIKQLNLPDFNKLLLLLTNLNINKSNESVSLLIQDYVTSNNLLDSFNNIDATSIKFIDPNVEYSLKLLGNFMPRKKYQKYLNGYITKYFECHKQMDIASALFFMRLYMNNKLYKFDNTIVSLLLSNMLSNTAQIPIPSSKLIDSNNNNISHFNSNNSIEYSLINSFTIDGLDRNSTLTVGMSSIDTELSRIDMESLIVILEGINRCNLSLEKVYYITDIVYKRIYNLLKATTRWNLKHIQQVLNFIIDTRIVHKELLDCIMEYIHDYFIVPIPNRSEFITDTTRITPSKINLYLLYLKANIFLNYTSLGSKAQNIYDYLLYQLKNDLEKTLINEHVLNNFSELLLYERYNNTKLYEQIICNLSSEQMELFSTQNVFKTSKGKIHSILYKQLTSDFISFHQIEGLTFDFYSPTLKQAVHILKKEYYYGKEGTDEVYLKHKAHLMLMISRKFNINLKLIPEHSIDESH